MAPRLRFCGAKDRRRRCIQLSRTRRRRRCRPALPKGEAIMTHSPPATARRRSGGSFRVLAAATLAAAALVPAVAPAGTTPFKDVRMIVEYNETAQDAGIQFFLDAEAWRSVDI